MNQSFIISAPEKASVLGIILSVRVNDLKIGWQTKPISDLIMIKGVRGYSCLYWSDGSKQMMAYTIKHYADQLPTNDFLRVHQNCVINRKFVQKAQLTHRGPLLRLATGTEIIISRRRWTMVKKELQHLYVGG
ncbi:LytR/AlgR family response regulator transcription factor [Spirosoma flavum]|uniref:LytR/AlgR family response regulator transcription factor n=1 Tax=Spirosoma flavum TaxID=2048557 RepID=A0ABW6AL95_9BACT